MNFTEFKNGPAGSPFAGLGKEWADLLQGNDCFEDLRREVVIRNAKDIGLFVTAVRRYAGACSSGEFRSARDLYARRLWAPGRRPRRRQGLAGPRHGMRPAIPRRHRRVRDGGAVRNAGPQATSAIEGREWRNAERWRLKRGKQGVKGATL
jgi:hypothetical protein